MEYQVERKGKRDILKFEVDGLKYELPLPKNCPPEFIRNLYEAKLKALGKGDFMPKKRKGTCK